MTKEECLAERKRLTDLKKVQADLQELWKDIEFWETSTSHKRGRPPGRMRKSRDTVIAEKWAEYERLELVEKPLLRGVKRDSQT